MTIEQREMISPKDISVHTSVSPNSKRVIHHEQMGGSTSEVEEYGNNFGQYVQNTSHGVGMVHTRNAYFPSHASSVEGPSDLAGSSATYLSGRQYVNSSQHIRMEDSSSNGQLGANSISGGGLVGGANIQGATAIRTGGSSYGSSSNLPNYGNNVQITTSRITTDRGEFTSGQTLNRP